MLVLSIKSQESILIGDNIKVMVVKIEDSQVKIGIEAPREILIIREELVDKQIIKELNI